MGGKIIQGNPDTYSLLVHLFSFDKPSNFKSTTKYFSYVKLFDVADLIDEKYQ